MTVPTVIAAGFLGLCVIEALIVLWATIAPRRSQDTQDTHNHAEKPIDA